MGVTQAEAGPQREENAVTLPLRVVTMGFVLAFAATGRASAQAAPVRSPVGQAVHWCVFNRPCNWTGHATIAGGIVWGLSRADVKPEIAATLAALVFVGKEVRDDRKWGNVLGTPDSMGDLLSGLAGAYVGYRLFRRGSGKGVLPVAVSVHPDEGAHLEFRFQLGDRSGN
jgi:hypothetical protein